jgi:hypothetical protein
MQKDISDVGQYPIVSSTILSSPPQPYRTQMSARKTHQTQKKVHYPSIIQGVLTGAAYKGGRYKKSHFLGGFFYFSRQK